MGGPYIQCCGSCMHVPHHLELGGWMCTACEKPCPDLNAIFSISTTDPSSS